MSNKVVLIIDDDPEIRDIVSRHCEALGYSSEQVGDGPSGVELALKNKYALIVLDLGLPKLGGHEVCRKIRKEDPEVPILVVTGERGEATTVLTLELGADEFVNKPIQGLEFRARARALLRRAGLGGGREGEQSEEQDQLTSEATIIFRDFTINSNLREVFCGDTMVELTTGDYDLFKILLDNRNRVLSRDKLASLLWGYENYSATQGIRTALSRLRGKLDSVGARSPYIVNQRGYGYRLAKEDE